MIKIQNQKESFIIMKYYYEHGWSWMWAETFECYKLITSTGDPKYPYYVWDLESMEKHYNSIDRKSKNPPDNGLSEFMWANSPQKYICYNDMWTMTGKQYIQKIFRKNKLERILK